MIQLERNISDLLYQHDCVVVEGFGGFVTNPNAAFIDAEKSLIYPPGKRITFNSGLTHNDGLLATTLAKEQSIAYEEANELIQTVVAQWKQRLKQSQSLHLASLGVFSKNEDGNIVFKENHTENYALSSFGLHAVIAKQVEKKPAVERILVKPTIKPKHLESIREEVKEKQKRRKKWPIAVIGVPVLLVTLMFAFKDNRVFNNDVQLTDFNLFSASKDKEVYSPKETIETPSITLIEEEIPSVEVESLPHQFHVIAGSFKVKQNAQNMSSRLQSNQFSSSVILGDNGYYRVTYNSFKTLDIAEIHLKKIKEEENQEAWLLEQTVF